MLKIIGNKNNIGNKAIGILKLSNSNFEIPETLIIEGINIKKIKNINFSKNIEKFILRPSFDIEDSEGKSFAGFFNSLFPITKSELLNILQEKGLDKLFLAKGNKLQSIIIQEYIEADYYGVYFTRDSNNILNKGGLSIGKTSDGITSGKEKGLEGKLSFLQKKEIEFIGKNIEKDFGYPQDIEFCIKNNKVILLQSRFITTGNSTIYDFDFINKLNGVYEKVIFPEFGEHVSVFTYSILDNIIEIIFLGGNMYLKKGLFSFNKCSIIKLDLFSRKYKKYLFYKVIHGLIKKISFSKYDLKVLNIFYKDYNFTFDLFRKSNLGISFEYKTNYITKGLLRIEKLKKDSFIELEKLKKDLLISNKYGKDIIYLKIGEYLNNSLSANKLIIKNRKKLDISDVYGAKLIFINGVNTYIEGNKDMGEWIYKGNIEGKVVNIENIKKIKSLKQVLFLKKFDIYIYDYLPFISGVVINEGSIYSHNSIILREAKVPSVFSDEIYTKYLLKNDIYL